MLASPAVGEVVDHGLHAFEGTWCVGPQVSAMRLAGAGLEHRYRRLVGMQHAMSQDGFLERVDQGLQAYAAGSDPCSERRARNGQAGALEDGFLAVQRKVVSVLGHHHLRQEAGGGDALVDHLGGHRRLDQRLALRAGPLASNMPLDGEHAGNVVELLGHVLADALEGAAARAGGRLGFVVNIDAWQVCRQRRAAWLLLVVGLGRRAQLRQLFFDGGQVGVKRLFQEVGLRRVELLAALSEAQALVLCELVGELVDLGGLERDLARELLDRAVLGLEQALLLSEVLDEPEGHLAQLFCIEALQLFGIHHEHVWCRPSV
jgi:hypothetical protein